MLSIGDVFLFFVFFLICSQVPFNICKNIYIVFQVCSIQHRHALLSSPLGNIFNSKEILGILKGDSRYKSDKKANELSCDYYGGR